MCAVCTTVPRHIYPGQLITSADWMGDMAMKVRGHAKNIFNGQPVDTGEYAFGRDARDIIGERGKENWFITVVKHEACHDLDAYVRRDPDLRRRWGQMLVTAAGPDVRADPTTGWYSQQLTQEHFKQAGWWDGDPKTWKQAWSEYWSKPPGSEWKQLGFMRGSSDMFLSVIQESLATQGNQHFNTTEGRLEVAIDRWKRGYRGNLSEVLLFIEIWSAGLDKVKFYENDTACNQVIRMAMLRRNARGYIDRVELPERTYEFAVDADGQVTSVSVSAKP